MSNRTCTAPDCGRTHRSRGYCSSHYAQLRRGVEIGPIKNRAQMTLAERLWEKVDKSSNCWVWVASKNSWGYGVINVSGTPRLAHRISWELLCGDLPKESTLDHMCHNRVCVNPDHLRMVTRAQNSHNLKGAHKDSKTGVRGVSWDKRKERFKAESMINGRRYWIGSYKTLQEAEEKSVNWRREHMPYSTADAAPNTPDTGKAKGGDLPPDPVEDGPL